MAFDFEKKSIIFKYKTNFRKIELNWPGTTSLMCPPQQGAVLKKRRKQNGKLVLFASCTMTYECFFFTAFVPFKCCTWILWNLARTKINLLLLRIWHSLSNSINFGICANFRQSGWWWSWFILFELHATMLLLSCARAHVKWSDMLHFITGFQCASFFYASFFFCWSLSCIAVVCIVINTKKIQK